MRNIAPTLLAVLFAGSLGLTPTGSQAQNATPLPTTKNLPGGVISKEALSNKKFRFQRPGNRPEIVLTLQADGTVQGNDHPNEAQWEASANQLILKAASGKHSDVFDKLGGGDGPMRLTGHYSSDAKAKVSLTEVK